DRRRLAGRDGIRARRGEAQADVLDPELADVGVVDGDLDAVDVHALVVDVDRDVTGDAARARRRAGLEDLRQRDVQGEDRLVGAAVVHGPAQAQGRVALDLHAEELLAGAAEVDLLELLLVARAALGQVPAEAAGVELDPGNAEREVLDGEDAAPVVVGRAGEDDLRAAEGRQLQAVDRDRLGRFPDRRVAR